MTLGQLTLATDLGLATRPTVRTNEDWVASNEVGWGVVPENALARRFRDEAGRLHQALARAADAVHLVAAGLSLRMK